MRPPLERTHDISQIGYHMKDLRTFGEDLTNAAAGAFPKGSSRYNEVHVLLLSWEDDRLGVIKEINELRSVLDQTYHYHTEEWKIPSTRSHNSLIRRLTDFLLDYESKENLLLVYYGGHGHLNDDRQLRWSCTEFENSPTVQWVGIQNMLEQATSDVLILLDCCAAATASAELGSGVTEVIAACGFETSAPGVCEHSFTRGLIEELRYCCKRTPISAAMLHMKVLSRMKYWKPKTVETRSGELAFHERRRTPVHTTLTNEGKPRSIVLSPIESSTFLSPEISSSLAHSPFSDSSSQDVQMEDSSNDSAMTSIQSSVSSSGNYFEQSCPTVLIAVALEEDQRFQLDTWVEWLRDIPAIAKHARLEGIYESFSTLMLISLPVFIWDLIPNSPAVSFVGFIKSKDFLKNRPKESSTAQAASSIPTSARPPAVIEALTTTNGLTLGKSREPSAHVAGQALTEKYTSQSPGRPSAQQRCRICENHGLNCDRDDRESGEYETTTKFPDLKSQRSLVDTTRGNLAENATSVSIIGANPTITLHDITRFICTSEPTSSSLRQTCSAVTTTYDTYIQFLDLFPDCQELLMGLVIEGSRIDLWRRFVLANDKAAQGNLPTYEIGLWALFECILTRMLETFSEMQHAMEEYRIHANITSQEGLSSALQLVSLQPAERSHEGSESPETMSTATKSPPENSLIKPRKTLGYDRLEKKCIERLLQTLCYWNDSLDGLTPLLERESSRRHLRAHFSTSNIAELRNLEAAAAFLKHQDIERMANIRSFIEQENHELDHSQLQSPDNQPSTPSPEYRLEADQFEWQEAPYRTGQPRAMATLRGESVIVDWQNCLDDSWRREHPATYRRRTQNLITILNTGLRPVNVSVLHCVGYLERKPNITGYAFRLPPSAGPGQMPVTLHHMLCNIRKSGDIPDVGERHQLAEALVSIVYEIHNIGWSHKNIQPKNVLFWPDSKAKIDISKPYLIGFDISIPNQPGEFSERPLSHPGDDIYRHPLYKGAVPYSFQPSFDMYSLGVVLYEIGLWRHKTEASQAAPGTSESTLISTHDFDSSYSYAKVKLGLNSSHGELRRVMGKNYRDAVITCLERGFYDAW